MKEKQEESVGTTELRICKSCEKWYGGEDDGYGPCAIKHMRGDKRFITYGYHVCDELEYFR